MTGALARMRAEIGGLGLVCLFVLAGAGGFQLLALGPLQEFSARLDAELEKTARISAPDGAKRAGGGTAAAQMAAFYRFFERPQRMDDWLAKLYVIATAAGLDLRTADYRLAERRYRIERYEIRFPVTGSYAQLRAFIEAAMAEIPVLSLDHASFRRKDAGDGRVDAEIVLTLHLLGR